MMQHNKIITKILQYGTLAGAFGLIFTVIFQILTRRFFVEFAPSWTEEASRFFFVYAISFAAGLAQKDDYFVSMDYVYRKFKPEFRKVADLIIHMISCILFLLMAVFSVQFIYLGSIETSPSLGLSMAIAFTSMLIMSGSIFYFLLIQLIQKVRTSRK
ncbi:MAG: TRAP transporter small permease [Cyclobacteriaceae bacterium]|nr:TRAP transporter small permease [Cyclobacteriaceae bacterium]